MFAIDDNLFAICGEPNMTCADLFLSQEDRRYVALRIVAFRWITTQSRSEQATWNGRQCGRHHTLIAGKPSRALTGLGVRAVVAI
jgi:hypothetical protein